MKILLAIDASPASDAAVSELTTRPWPAGTSVEVLSVVEPASPWTLSEVAEELARRADERVLQVAELLRARGLDAKATALPGDPKAVIVDQAAEMGADFVMLGSHGRTGIAEFLLGSVARAVVRFAPCSVRIVRGNPNGKESRQGMKILLATDGSESALLAARSIAGRPWPGGTEVRILSVVELGLSTVQAFLEPPFVDSPAMQMLRSDAMKYSLEAIRAAEEIVTRGGLAASEDVSVLVERPQQIIVNEAKQWGADLVVLGSHGRKKLSRFLLGSVSEAVATHAPCSVEVIRKKA